MQIVLFQTIQFSISTHLIVKNILFLAIPFIQTVLIQLIQFSISGNFVYTVKCQNSFILNNSIYCKYSFNVKNGSISNNSVLHKYAGSSI